ncbi:MAG: S9 family peptidase [Gemmatimonadota bacterium]
MPDGLVGPLAAQELTVEGILASGELYATTLPELSWTPDGERFTFISPGSEEGTTDLLAHDVETGDFVRMVSGTNLVPAGEEEPIPIEGYQFSPDGDRLLIATRTEYVWRDRTKGYYYVYDLGSGALEALSDHPGFQQFAKFSPDGTRVGFVRENDIFVKDLESGDERQLTRDGEPDRIFNGTFDWVYEEELDLQDGWRWSPDGERIAFWQLDDAPVETMVYDLEYLELYPEPVAVPYPKAGTDNPEARIGVVGVESGRIRWMDIVGEADEYLVRMDWADGPDELVIQSLNRLQNRLEVLLADAETGESRVVLAETSESWVDVDRHFRWLDGGRRFLWSSERDGYNHLYLYDRSGELVRQLTTGDWGVTTPVEVDHDGGWVYFLGHREGPLTTDLYRVRTSDGTVERVTEGQGTHEVQMNPRATWFLDTRSRAGVPPTTVLRRAGGEAVRTLVENQDLATRLDSLGMRRPEFFTFTTADDVELDAWMIRPPDFDESREYPVVLYVYGGPGVKTVTDRWTGFTYLWHQLLAERGYIVASIDGRGTPGRGREFEEVVYRRLGELETRDQIAAADHLASLDYVDPDRIGIYGSSYGGYVTLLAMMKGEGRFRAGISRAPVTDWRLYDTIYTERFMGLPDDNAEGYRESAPLTHAADLQGSLLLLHGTGDDNVHFQNSVQLVRILQEEAKQFDFMIYPYGTHAIRGLGPNVHLYGMMLDFFLEEL